MMWMQVPVHTVQAQQEEVKYSKTSVKEQLVLVPLLYNKQLS